MAPSLNPLDRALKRILGALEAAGVDLALVGGLAVSARAEPRTTRDVDLAISVGDDAEAERILFHLQRGGYAVRMLLEHEPTGRVATARLLRESERGVFVDLLFASSGIEVEVVRGAHKLEILEGLVVPVASRAHLIAMKVLARDDRRRPQDWDDLRALLAVSTARDIAAARSALRLIAKRGFDRGRPLDRELDRALRTLRGSKDRR